jgi:hypothetical protein
MHLVTFFMRPPSLNEQQRFGLLHPVHDGNACVSGLYPETVNRFIIIVKRKLAKISYFYLIFYFKNIINSLNLIYF